MGKPTAYKLTTTGLNVEEGEELLILACKFKNADCAVTTS